MQDTIAVTRCKPEAVTAGYDVLTTCSPANFDVVRALGARQAFDYRTGSHGGARCRRVCNQAGREAVTPCA